MPKIKTHRGAAKRFNKTGNGKIKRARAYHSHLLECKSPKRKKACYWNRLRHILSIRVVNGR